MASYKFQIVWSAALARNAKKLAATGRALDGLGSGTSNYEKVITSFLVTLNKFMHRPRRRGLVGYGLTSVLVDGRPHSLDRALWKVSISAKRATLHDADRRTVTWGVAPQGATMDDVNRALEHALERMLRDYGSDARMLLAGATSKNSRVVDPVEYELAWEGY